MSLKVKFLNEFTKEIITNAIPASFTLDKRTVNDEVKENKKQKEDNKLDNVKMENKEHISFTKINSNKTNNQPNKITKETERYIVPQQIKKPKLIVKMEPSISTELAPSPVQNQKTSMLDNNTPNINQNKIELLLKNPSIELIDCQGPGRAIGIKQKNSRVIITKIRLTKEEIESIIDDFSSKSKIPRIGGVFKAIVGNLMINATETNQGPRFIISKIKNIEKILSLKH